jgi:hypothetical protein
LRGLFGLASGTRSANLWASGSFPTRRETFASARRATWSGSGALRRNQLLIESGPGALSESEESTMVSSVLVKGALYGRSVAVEGDKSLLLVTRNRSTKSLN